MAIVVWKQNAHHCLLRLFPIARLSFVNSRRVAAQEGWLERSLKVNTEDPCTPLGLTLVCQIKSVKFSPIWTEVMTAPLSEVSG